MATTSSDPHLLMKSRDGGVQGCMAAADAGTNMLRDVFPSLLAGQPIPADAHAWEISRFALNLMAPVVTTRSGWSISAPRCINWSVSLGNARSTVM